jgi:hypothetical protein
MYASIKIDIKLTKQLYLLCGSFLSKELIIGAWVCGSLEHIIMNENIKHGNLDIVGWLHVKNPNVITISTIDTFFKGACITNHIEVAQWLTQIKIEGCSCENEWLYADNYFGCNVIDNVFINSCREGLIDISKWLVSKGANISNTLAFIDSCKNGKIEIVEWLIECLRENFSTHVYTINSMSDYDVTITIYGNLEIAKLLHARNIDHREPEVILFNCVRCCELDIIEWLCIVYSNNIHLRHIQRAFKISCANKKRAIAEWFLSNFLLKDGICVIADCQNKPKHTIITCAMNMCDSKLKQKSDNELSKIWLWLTGMEIKHGYKLMH